MSEAASRNARRQRGSDMHRALRPQDEVARRVVRNHHNANLKNLRQTEEEFKQRKADLQPRPSFKLKRFQQVSSRVHDAPTNDIRSSSRKSQTVVDHVPKRKLGQLPPYLKKMRARAEQQHQRDSAEKSAEHAPEGFRLLSEEQRADILGTLKAQLTGLEKEIEKKFPAHKHVPRSQLQAQQELLQQIEHVKAMQKKFSVKKVWVEIDDEDAAEPDADGANAPQSSADDEIPEHFETDLVEPDLDGQLASLDIDDEHQEICTSGGYFDESNGIRAESSSPEIEGLETIQMPHDLKVTPTPGHDKFQERDSRRQLSRGDCTMGEEIAVRKNSVGAMARTGSSSPEIDGLDTIKMPQDLKATRPTRAAAGKMSNHSGGTPWATDVDSAKPQRQVTASSRSPWATDADLNQPLIRPPVSSRVMSRTGNDPRFASSIQFG